MRDVMRVKSVFWVVVAMILHGWWVVRFHGHQSYRSEIKNLFGPGYWSWRKFATCGRIVTGYWVPSEDGKSRLFHAEAWEYQEMFVTRVKEAQSHV